MRKTGIFRPGLHCKSLKSNIDTFIDGSSVRHLPTRIEEPGTAGMPVHEHFTDCTSSQVSLDDVKSLEMSPSLKILLALETLHIRAIRPSLNTKDEHRSRALTYALMPSEVFSRTELLFDC